ncbi:energy transducer TonB [Croceivirga radicis]|uniref:Energy transducer TonB n=1 Tax=Croceivirga radicis TaxID=1929488 RepID=A0A1V6LU38_9FLAO|nr:M56 family metallopeptidase [Croceivirga radicis]OQD43659.1 energy transducer TonB [Croceivirga radicis]
MLTYILECVAFQLICLLVYDLFLKKETFFQWNRAFLIVSYLLSLVLPWVKIEALKTTVSKEAVYYPANWFVQIEGVVVEENPTATSFLEQLSAWEWAYIFGVLGMAVWLSTKLYRIRKLHREGFKKYYPEYTRVTVQKSNVAFSFFKSIFMGDALPKNKELQILEHELVHIKQWHSLDLFFFELMRIAFWFNPLVYVYQNRISELHEFIADAKVAKYQRKEQYSILLSQAFKTENISFINQFFTQSLIKKRIVMLSKQKSKRIFQLKYILLIPIVLGMLVYTSCEQSVDNQEEKIEAVSLNEVLVKTDTIITSTSVPFSTIDQVPVFPGCESAADKRACFQENIQNHIRKHFNYPSEAQEQNIQGRVAIMFTIQEDGTIGKIRKRGPHALLENEAVRIIERLPKMEPGKNKGKVVSVPFSIPITFKLASNTSNADSNEVNEISIIGYEGLNTMNSSTLFFIDGKESSVKQMNTLNPHSIESVQVLKDEVAIEKYGQKGKNGVVEIKTKNNFKAQAMHVKDFKYVPQQGLTKGKIISGEKALPGVNISIKGGDATTVSDFDGNFKINAQPGQVIEFDYIGFPKTALLVKE